MVVVKIVALLVTIFGEPDYKTLDCKIHEVSSYSFENVQANFVPFLVCSFFLKISDSKTLLTPGILFHALITR